MGKNKSKKKYNKKNDTGEAPASEHTGGEMSDAALSWRGVKLLMNQPQFEPRAAKAQCVAAAYPGKPLDGIPQQPSDESREAQGPS